MAENEEYYEPDIISVQMMTEMSFFLNFLKDMKLMTMYMLPLPNIMKQMKILLMVTLK